MRVNQLIKNSSIQLIIFILFASLIKAISYLAIEYLIKGSSFHHHILADIRGWHLFVMECMKGSIPYVTFTREYPAGIGQIYWALSFLPGIENLNYFININIIANCCFDVFISVVLYKILTALKIRSSFLLALSYLFFPSILVLSPFRFESLVNFTMIAAIICLYKNRNNLSSVLFGLGTSMKIYPVFFFLANQYQEVVKSKCYSRAIKNIIFFSVTLISINLPLMLYCLNKNHSIDNWASTYKFHAERPLFADTILGVIKIWQGYPPIEKYASLFSIVLMGMILLLRPKMCPIQKTIAIYCASLIFNKVYSPQFHLWFLPLCIILLPKLNHKIVFVALVLTAELLNIFIFPFAFEMTLREIQDFQEFFARDKGGVWTVLFSLAIIIRGVIMTALTAFLIMTIQKIPVEEKVS